ncbi:MAG: hypothetical protein JWR32_2724 [Mycobacterium sp.]|nr:hypothetical protein [Mycobacterium sp.]
MAEKSCAAVLASSMGSNDTERVTTTSLPASVLSWLRAGYPEGVPGPDRVPLLALLRRTELSDEQVKEVVRSITAAAPDGAIERDEIAGFIAGVTDREPSDDDVKRVACRLAAGGWPLAGLTGASP